MFLLVLSLAGLAAALVLPGLSDLVLITGPSALASLFLLLRGWGVRRRPGGAGKAGYIVIDGSNVMHWADGTPRLDPVQEVVRHLERRGFTPGVVFDANAGYLLSGRYQHDHAFEKLLGLPRDRVMVVDKGTPADPTILRAASDMTARVVSNDRYRDWAAEFPQIRQPGFLVRGGYSGGQLWLDLDPPDGGASGGKRRA
ncbi:hypothetical protein roselon_03647 [Roseibacterium elongatum DSM 19469]|uniref:RNase NYN domain-containing protein n=1 Tax=Roseicyclus elongatus DSM 19469 TaxID=1294273 RepID=W8RXF7_9RHOB|nr:hypothetical protein roselon_03647 [Roseibacterium elongatum DSM 19469]